MGLFRCIYFLFKWTLILSVLIFLLNTWLNTKTYIFSEEAVAKIARNHYDKTQSGSFDVKSAYKKLYADFQKKYPGHILPEQDLQWVFMNAGGWMGAMCLLHASLTEYVLFFGTPIETEGHSGRYWANISDTLLTGEFHQWKEGELDVHKYKPGDTVVHAIGEVTAVNFKAGTWMVEYGRGFIPSTLTFALADTFFSTTDFVTLFYILKVYTKAMLLEAGYYIVNAKEIIGS